MDSKRVASGFIVGIVVAIMLIIPNKYVIGILLTIIALMAMNEYLKAIEKVCKPIKWIAYASCLIIMLSTLLPLEHILQISLFTVPIFIVMLFLQVIATDMKTTFKDMAYTLLGICYISIFTTFLTLVNGMKNGKLLIIYILIASWGTDIFAFCVGKKIGKHKFSKVSPKKSIEGCIAGTIGSTIIMLIYTWILNEQFSFDYSYLFVLSMGVVLSLIGQIGDFSASTIKRYVDIKDYSNLLPGHGGVLDRIDSVIFVAPFAYMLFTMI